MLLIYLPHVFSLKRRRNFLDREFLDIRSQIKFDTSVCNLKSLVHHLEFRDDRLAYRSFELTIQSILILSESNGSDGVSLCGFSRTLSYILFKS